MNLSPFGRTFIGIGIAIVFSHRSIAIPIPIAITNWISCDLKMVYQSPYLFGCLLNSGLYALIYAIFSIIDRGASEILISVSSMSGVLHGR